MQNIEGYEPNIVQTTLDHHRRNINIPEDELTQYRDIIHSEVAFMINNYERDSSMNRTIDAAPFYYSNSSHFRKNRWFFDILNTVLSDTPLHSHLREFAPLEVIYSESPKSKLGLLNEHPKQQIVSQVELPHESTNRSTQEEFLHTALDIVDENVAIINFVGNNGEPMDQLIDYTTQNICLHSSIIFDSILTAASLFQGTTIYETLRLESQLQVEKNINGNNLPECKNIFGKQINRRFVYPDITLEQLGMMFINFNLYMGELDRLEGKLQADAFSIFELASLNFGINHRDLTLELYDLNIPANLAKKDFTKEEKELIGMEMFKFGLRLLENMNVNPEFREEMLTHHTARYKKVPREYFQYEVQSDYFIEEETDTDEELENPIRIAATEYFHQYLRRGVYLARQIRKLMDITRHKVTLKEDPLWKEWGLDKDSLEAQFNLRMQYRMKRNQEARKTPITSNLDSNLQPNNLQSSLDKKPNLYKKFLKYLISK